MTQTDIQAFAELIWCLLLLYSLVALLLYIGRPSR